MNKKSDKFKQLPEDPNVRELVNVITNIVDPTKQSELNINLNHETQLIGTKSKKQHSKKKRKLPTSKSLSRKQLADLGLYTLPTKSLKYDDLLPLHELWKGYMCQQLNLLPGEKPPEVHEAAYDNFSKLLMKSDFHGSIVTVTRSKCPSLVGTSGIVAMDTKGTFKILGRDNKLRTIPKQDSVFKFELNSVEVTIFGKHLNIRPAERSVKKIKCTIDLDL